jgi:hypothetical protein
MLEHTLPERKDGHWEIALTVIYINVKYRIYLYVFWFLDFRKRYEVHFLYVSYTQIWLNNSVMFQWGEC